MSWALAAAVLALAQDMEDPPGAWIDRLAHEDPAVREDAAARLHAAGRSAWADLADAAERHPDLEARSRARDLLHASRQRRRLSHRVLDEHPAALGTLTAGGTAEKVRLIRTLGRHYEESAELLLEFLRDPEPEIVIAAADALHENRNFQWTRRLLDLYASEDCSRTSRIYELLSSAASRLPRDVLQGTLDRAGPRGRNRLLNLSVNTGLPLSISAETLRGMLRGGDPAARRMALAWMRDRGPLGNLMEIEPLLSCGDPSLAADALATLRHLRHRPDPGRVEALLDHEEALVREEAARTLSAFDEREAAPALRRLLDDPSTSVRQAALAGLWKLEDTAALDDALRVFLEDAGEQREQAAAILGRHREWALPRARRARLDEDPERRLRAFELVRRFEGPPVLQAAARDPDEAIRRWALAELLKTDGPAVVDALQTLSQDSSEPIRFEAVRALVRRGRREHLPSLQHFLTCSDGALRYEAAETILEHGGDRAEPLARTLVEDPDAPLRRLGLHALAERGDREFADRALEGLSDPDARVRRAAAQYLSRMLAQRRDGDLLTRLAGLLASGEGEPLALAFNLVATYGDARAAASMRELLGTGRAPSLDRAVRVLAEWAGERALKELTPFLGDDPALNDIVLSRIRDLRQRSPEAPDGGLREAVVRLAAHADRRVRRSAASAAEGLGLPSDALLALAGDPEPSVRHAALGACARLGVAGCETILKARLEDEDPDVRLLAATLLARLDPASRPAIEEAMSAEECGWVRRRVEIALRDGAR
jgi:HEAT repeat protein